VERLTALLAGLLEALRGAAPAELCPGGWPWAVTALGVLVGLLPTAGAVVVALVRRRIGSRYRVPERMLLIGTGVLTAGLLPLLLFAATGRLFRAAVDPEAVSGFGREALRGLAEPVCFGGSQGEYLAGPAVTEAFGRDAVSTGLAVALLVVTPLFATVFVAAQARLALRRGPAWPAKFFWLPVLSLTVLTARTPAGTSGQLWAGFAAGAFLGMIVLLVVGTPSWDVVRRSLDAPERRPAPPRPAPAPTSTPEPQRGSGRADRLAERFAARRVEPPVVVAPERPAPPTRRGAAPPPTALAPGPPFAAAGGAGGAARFTVRGRLGSGGFGRVLLAHDARLGHLVALKAAHAPDEETQERIQREARALAAVRHPHCVRILDLVPAASDPGLAELEGMVLVMEYVDGPSLAELVRARGLLDDLAAARVWRGVAGALDAAHGRGVMHRDVKPGNIVMDPAGLAHLIDFGIARRTGDATMTMAGFVLGTPDFLAPEVACGERATPASDAWQLAATVSYALTGQPPRGSHADAVSGLRAAAAGARLTHLPAGSAHLALLRASLDTDPARRPSLAAVTRTLEDWLRRAGARPDGPVTAARAR
jgi:eukaryotic-like serine/threonine-protein kinase